MIVGICASINDWSAHLETQIEQLEKLDCEKIFQEKVSGVKQDRPEPQHQASLILSSAENLTVGKRFRDGSATVHKP